MIPRKIVNLMGGLLGRWSQPLRNQRGSLLVEVVLTFTVFGVVGVAVLGAVQTSHTTKRQFDRESTAENMIRNQLEYVFEQPYQNPLDSSIVPGVPYLGITPPSGYSVTTQALVRDATSDKIEKLVVTVYYDGQLVKTFETVRAKG